MSAAKLTQKATGTAQANAEVECKPDNSDTSTNLQARINRLEAQGRIQSAIMKKICTEAERRWNRDFNGDGLIGELKLVLLALAIGMIASTAVAEKRVDGYDHTRLGRSEVRSDESGNSTYIVDKVVVLDSLTVSNSITLSTNITVGSVTFDDGQVLQSADTTNVTLTGAERALSTFQITAGGSTNVAGDDMSLDIKGRDLWGTSTVYLAIDVDMTDTASGSQDGTVVLKIPIAGTETDRVTMNAAGVTIAGAINVSAGTLTNVTVRAVHLYNAGTFTNAGVFTASTNITAGGIITGDAGIVSGLDVSGATIGGITEANLVDKSAAETVSGIWTHSGSLLVTGVQTNSAVVTMTTNLNAGGIITGDAGLVSGLDVSGTTIGGITEANLVDKSAEETVSGIWTHSGALLVTGVQTNSAAVTMTTNATVAGTLGVSAAATFDNVKFNMSAIQDGTNGLSAGDLYYVSGDSNRVYVFQN